MNPVHIVYIIFGISILVFVLGLIFLLKMVFSGMKKGRKRKSEAHQKAYEESLEVLEQTRKDSTEIVENAVKKAEQTLSQTEFFQKEKIEEFNKSLHSLTLQAAQEFQQVAGEQTHDFETIFADVKKEMMKQAIDAVKQIEQMVQESAVEFRDTLRTQTTHSQDVIQKTLRQEYEKVAREIEEYKKEEITKVDSLVNEVVDHVASEVLAKSLSATDHEKLILEAFEKAKNDGIFSDQNST